MESKPLPFDVIEAAVSAIGKAFWYKDPIRALMLRAGVPPQLYDRYKGESKYPLSRHVFAELEKLGESGQIVARKIVHELCQIRAINDDNVNKSEGLAALERLRQLSKAILLESAADELLSSGRIRAQEEVVSQRRSHEGRLAELKGRFVGLMATADAQQRGYALEKLLEELFQLSEIDYRPSYKAPAQQIDGAFRFNSFDYLVETKWTRDEANLAKLNEFKGKVDRKITSTRGLFLSINGFSNEVVAEFQHGTSSNVILMTGEDLALILEGRISLRDALELKTTKAAHEGRIYIRLIDHC